MEDDAPATESSPTPSGAEQPVPPRPPVSEPAPAPAISSAPPSDEPIRKTPEQRKELLARQIQTLVANGRRVESQSDYQAVLVRGRRPNHLLHFFIGLFTFGIWWLVWIIITITGGEKREMATVDEWGNVAVQRL